MIYYQIWIYKCWVNNRNLSMNILFVIYISQWKNSIIHYRKKVSILLRNKSKGNEYLFFSILLLPIIKNVVPITQFLLIFSWKHSSFSWVLFNHFLKYHQNARNEAISISERHFNTRSKRSILISLVISLW